MRVTWKPIVAAVVFALCIAPTLISYAPYSFRWDDSEYMWRSVAASRGFWSADVHELSTAMVSIRPPIMTTLGLPWGPLSSWEDISKCFVTLATFNAIFVAVCLWLLLRVGLKPLYLVIGGVCVFAALGPYFTDAKVHYVATGLWADTLFAWDAFAALLLIPYEATTNCTSDKDSLIRGALWGMIFSPGAMTKASFFFFIAVIVPVLIAVRIRRSGLRSVLLSMISLIACMLPVAIYWLKYGLPALRKGWTVSFGRDASYYHIPFSEFTIVTIRQSPGMLLFLMVAAAAIVYFIIKRREVMWRINVIPVLVTVGYCAVSLASSNRQIRYSFVGIIALPFLLGVIASRQVTAFSRRSASIAAAVALGVLVSAAIPTVHRANRQCIAKCETVLDQAAESHAKKVLLATDSPSLNDPLLKLALLVLPSRQPIEANTLAWSAAHASPIEDDFRDIREADLVVFQDDGMADSPATNQRVSEYERFARQYFGRPIKVVDGLRMYGIHRH
jgi:hypothetical protein